MSSLSRIGPDFVDFIEQSKTLPTFCKLRSEGKIKIDKDGVFHESTDYKMIQLISHEQFQTVLQEYFILMGEKLRQASAWVSANPIQDVDLDILEFFPYAQKLIVPSGSRCIFKGDLHGDLHSLVAFIDQLGESGDTNPDDPLKLVTPLKLVFLGDYTDRGLWGVEVIFLLMLLKIKNPDQVFLIRGNHEDMAMTKDLGFRQEYKTKFGAEDPDGVSYEKMSAFYNTLPVVLYFGTEDPERISFVQCSHGGIEWGYNPEKLLNTEDKHYEWIEEFRRHSQCPIDAALEINEFGKKVLGRLIDKCEDFKAMTPQDPFRLGFMWNEFGVGAEDIIQFRATKIFSCNLSLTKATFAAASQGRNILVAGIRAHQHAPNFPHLNNNPLMDLLLEKKGCVKLWNAKSPTDISLEENTILTLLLSPDGQQGLELVDKLKGFTYDTTLTVITAPKVENWECTITNNEILDDAHNLIAGIRV